MKIKSKAHYRYTIALTQEEVNEIIDELHEALRQVHEYPALHMLREALRHERNDRH